MFVLVWIAVGIFVASTVGGIAFAVVRGLAAYRTLRRVGGELTAGVDRVTRGADELATKLELLADATGRLEPVLARLRASRARLNVLLQAIAEVRAGIGRLTAVVPRKS
jgi:hypothetical protein